MAIRKSVSGGTIVGALTEEQEIALANATTLTDQFTVDEDLNTISTTSTLITGTNSVGLGVDHTLSAGGSALALKIGDTKYFIPAQELAQGSGIRYLDITADEASKDVQGTHSTVVGVQDSNGIYYTESYTVSANELITGITFYPSETGYLKYKLYNGSDNTGTVIYEKVVEVTDATTSVTMDASFFLEEDTNIYAEVSGVSLYGSAADGAIYTAVNYMLASITSLTIEGVTYTGTSPVTVSDENVISLDMDASAIIATDSNGDITVLSSNDITGILVNNEGAISWNDEPTANALTLVDNTSTASTALTLSRTAGEIYPTISFINDSGVDYDAKIYAMGTGTSGEGWLLFESADTLAQGRLVVGSDSADTDHTLSVAGTAYVETSLAIGDITLEAISAVDYPLVVASDGTLSLQFNEDYFEVNDNDELDLILSNIDVLELKNASTLANGTIQGTFGSDAVVTDFDGHSVGDWWQCQFDEDDSSSESNYITLGGYTIYAGDKLYITTSTEDITLTSDTFSTYVAYIQNQDNTASDTIYGLVKLATTTPLVDSEDGDAGTANGLVANANHSHPFTTQPVEHGGTGLTEIAAGSVLYASSDDEIAALTNSSDEDTVLVNDAGSMSWSNTPTLNSLTLNGNLLSSATTATDLGSFEIPISKSHLQSVRLCNTVFSTEAFAGCLFADDDGTTYLYANTSMPLSLGSSASSVNDMVLSSDSITVNKATVLDAEMTFGDSGSIEGSGVILTGSANGTKYYLQVDDTDTTAPILYLVEV